ncbi:DNA-directed RNA polymerase subunit beta [Paenibacillus glycinis]|uniref:DNA-directed RNA polymerase subunit beta n=1 Tax=Paenibacillus glycinis TaxID=2697035 RepID=A0ABW9XWW5_9BACL|nr:DNA-directed RNA polymerase subunit beta [Paenibacillus glycinis]NBD26742.1 DNA-directed RNA polymerase subunit beta [Paenibacillus glycinis]
MPMDSKKETAAGLEGVTSAERSNLLGASTAGDAVRGTGKRPTRESSAAKEKTNVRKKRHPAVRALRWTLLKSIVPILCVLAILGGMYIGYAVVGKQPGGDILKIETWKHMYDLIFAD